MTNLGDLNCRLLTARMGRPFARLRVVYGTSSFHVRAEFDSRYGIERMSMRTSIKGTTAATDTWPLSLSSTVPPVSIR